MTRKTDPLRPTRPTTADAAHKLALELFVAGYEGDTLPASYRQRLEDGMAGAILFSRNLRKDPDGAIDVGHLTEQTAAIHGATELPALVAVDQEGGLVARLRAPFTHLPPMKQLARTGDVQLIQLAGEQTGRECLAAGFNIDFAPILDIDTNPDNPIIGDRAFGSTPDEVIARAGAFLSGLTEAGVLGCGKHFPGHGDTDTDSHLALPVLSFGRDRLQAVEMAPFRALAKRMPMVMTAHILFPELDAELPATLSPTILRELLTGWCGFEGVVVSDDLEMKGVAETFSFGQSVELGLAAGVDLFLVCRREDALEEAVDAAARVLQQQGVVSEHALDAIAKVRRLRTKQARLTPTERGVRAAIAHPDGVRLRKQLGIGTV